MPAQRLRHVVFTLAAVLMILGSACTSTDDERANEGKTPVAANDGVAFVNHWLMDDASKFDTLLAELPNTQAGDSSGWPEQYVIDQTVAVNDGYFVLNDDGGADRFYWFCRFFESCDADSALAVYPA